MWLIHAYCTYPKVDERRRGWASHHSRSVSCQKFDLVPPGGHLLRKGGRDLPVSLLNRQKTEGQSLLSQVELRTASISSISNLTADHQASKLMLLPSPRCEGMPRICKCSFSGECNHPVTILYSTGIQSFKMCLLSHSD